MVSSTSPILSIIIPSFNQLEGLKKTIQSCTGYGDVEIVVVDGDSTDGSKAWLIDNAELIPKLRTAPDKGIYDAMNKGIDLASGIWLCGQYSIPADRYHYLQLSLSILLSFLMISNSVLILLK